MGGERMLFRAWDGETRPWSVGELRPHFPDSPGEPRWIWAPPAPNCRTSRDNRRQVRAHTKLTMQRVSTDPLIEQLVTRGDLIVAGGYYSLDTGAVSLIA